MSIKLSHEQQVAVDAIGRWLHHGDEQAFVLAGYAGTGKTTIIRWVLEAAAVRAVCAVCATPTGKAANVLESKLPEGTSVSTLHSLLYQPIEVTEHHVERAWRTVEELEERGLPTEDAEKRARKLDKLMDRGGCEFGGKEQVTTHDLVIVDEASMVGDFIESDLRKVARKVLFIGDPGQLPPVEGRDFFERCRPDVVLEQIHRQAADSAILRMATAVRNGETFRDWNDSDCRLVRGGADVEELLEASQVITGMNATRRRINQDCRKALDCRGEYPEMGEPMMCLRNERGRGLTNGVGGLAASHPNMNSFGDVKIDVSYEGRLLKDLVLDPLAFAQYANPKMTRRDVPDAWGSQFDFGYAITVHKSQGSEWSHVLVWDDKMRRSDREARKRWIYTAATRASVKLTWVNPS